MEKEKQGKREMDRFVYLPQPESPHSRNCHPGEEEGCDQQPGWISIIQAGLLLTSASLTRATLVQMPSFGLY